jgi:hypothetical protein
VCDETSTSRRVASLISALSSVFPAVQMVRPGETL